MLHESEQDRNFALLAPASVCVPPGFQTVELDQAAHAAWQKKMQRLRGRLYLEDGAIEAWQLSPDGAHVSARDDLSWHLLSLMKGEVVGCARLQVYSPTVDYSELAAAQSALAQSARWGPALKESILSDLHCAQAGRMAYAEAGGWALAAELRHTTEALQIALRTYAVAQLLGGCLGIATATVRHHSASILKRLGGTSMPSQQGALPPYYDPQYRCDMEIVRFDSRRPNPKYQTLVDRIKAELPAVQVVCPTPDLRESEVATWKAWAAGQQCPAPPLPVLSKS